MSNTTRTRNAAIAKLLKIIPFFSEIMCKDPKNDLGKLGESSFHNTQYADIPYIVRLSLPSNVLTKLVSIECNNFSFFAVQRCIFCFCEHISTCLLSTSTTLFPSIKLVPAFPSSSTPIFPFTNSWFLCYLLHLSCNSSLNEGTLKLFRTASMQTLSQWGSSTTFLPYRPAPLLNRSWMRNTQSRSAEIVTLRFVSSRV